MKFIEIDMEQWARKEHYRNDACSYSLTNSQNLECQQMNRTF